MNVLILASESTPIHDYSTFPPSILFQTPLTQIGLGISESSSGSSEHINTSGSSFLFSPFPAVVLPPLDILVGSVGVNNFSNYL